MSGQYGSSQLQSPECAFDCVPHGVTGFIVENEARSDRFAGS
jgi:hypothetical protein